MSKPLTIKALWLCSWYPTRQLPFNAQFVRRQAEATAAFADITVLLALPDTEGGKNYALAVQKLSPHLTEITVFYPDSTLSIVQGLRRFRAFQKGYAFLKKETGKPDLVHLNVIGSVGFYALWLYFREKLPYVISEHWSGYLPETSIFHRLSPILKSYYRLVSRHAAGIVAMTEAFAAAIRACGLNNRFFIVPNIVDTAAFSPATDRFQPRATDAPFRLIHVSGLDDRTKNISGILRGVARLAQRRSDFTLNILGDAEELPPYIKLAAELGISEKIIFPETYSTEKTVSEAMKKADIFVLFSRFETYSVVVSEAMSCGVPVVASKTCGIEERVTEAVGVLVDSENEAGLAAAIEVVMDNYAAYNPLTIRGLVENACSPKAVGAAIFKVYQTVLGK